MPGKISTLCRKVCQTSGRVELPKGTVGSGWSRVLTWPVWATAGQLSAMNSCHAKTLASCKLADAAPPGISVGGNHGLLFEARANVTGPQLPGATASSVVRGAGGALRWHAPSNNATDNSTSEKSTKTLLRVRVLIAEGEFTFVFMRAFFFGCVRNTSVDLVSI